MDAAAPLEGVHALPGFDEYLLGYQDRSLAWRLARKGGAIEAEPFEGLRRSRPPNSSAQARRGRRS